MYRNNNKVFASFQFKTRGAQELLSETPGEPDDVPVMRMKKWPLAALILLILAAAVCTLPWVSRVGGTLYGAEVTPDGRIIAEGEFVLNGKLRSYLLREDQFKLLDIHVPNREIHNLSAQAASVYRDDSGLLYTTLFFLELPEFDSDHNIYTGHLVFPEDQSWFVLEVTGRIFVGSTDAMPDWAGILEQCRPFLMLRPE